MRYLDEDLYIDIDFGRTESGTGLYRDSGTFEIQWHIDISESWQTSFKGTFNLFREIWQGAPLRIHINDFVWNTKVPDLSKYYQGNTERLEGYITKYRVVATSEYGDTQTSKPIEVFPAYRNPETLSQMPLRWYNAPMSIVRQPMVPHYPANIEGYNTTLLIYRSSDAPALTPEEGLWLADSKGLFLKMESSVFENLRGISYYRNTWQDTELGMFDDGTRKVLTQNGSGFETIKTTPGLVNPKYVFVKFTKNKYVLEDVFILDECPRDFYLHWIDRYGGVQCQPLRQNYKQTQNYTRESTQNLINETHDYLNNVQTTYTFNTDWINKQEMAVWESIMVSPMVCLIDTRANKSWRVLVTDKSFSQKTFDNTHTLFNMTFNVKLDKTQKIYL